MSGFEPTEQIIREAFLFFYLKKSAAEIHWCSLQETYDEHALSETTCRDWFRRFQSGDFDLKDKERSGESKKIEDKSLEAW